MKRFSIISFSLLGLITVGIFGCTTSPRRGEGIQSMRCLDVGNRFIRYPTMAALPNLTIPLGFGGQQNAPLWNPYGQLTRCYASYPHGKNSPYVLPFSPMDDSLNPMIVTQGNCSSETHNGIYAYAYDFNMNMGTCIEAIRGGVVESVSEATLDYAVQMTRHDGFTYDNFVKIRHSDGTLALYLHLMHLGVIPEEGDQVLQGQAIAFSGYTGRSYGAHLHLAVLDQSGNSIPITFRNARHQKSNNMEYGPLKGACCRGIDFPDVSYYAVKYKPN